MLNFRMPALILSLLCVVACTRNTGDTSTFTLSINTQSHAKAATDPNLVMNTIIINVSGPGISPSLFYQWQNNDAGTLAPPSSIPFTVARGSGRIVQVLEVYKDSTKGTQAFYYGDATGLDLNADTATVGVTTTAAGTSSFDGHVYGRYMDDSVGGGPSGVMTGLYTPNDGTPPMTVTTSPIFAGWFSVFVLDTASFTYTLNGKTIFDSININSAIFKGSASVVRANIPSYDRTNDSGTTTESASRAILGFFGPNAPKATHLACYDNRNGQATSVKMKGSATPMLWDGTTLAAGDAGPDAGSGTGYVPGDASVCGTSATEFRDHLILHYETLPNGHDSLSGFKGPFAMTFPGAGQMPSTIVGSMTDATTAALAWNYLPGVTNGPLGVAGVTPFARGNPGRTLDNNSISADNGIACSRITTAGYAVAGADAKTTADQPSATLTLSGLPASPQIVICPYIMTTAGRVYLDIGQEAQVGGGGMTNATAPLDMKIIGTNTMGSFTGGSGLGTSNYTLLTSNFSNGFNALAFFSNGKYLTQSDLSAVGAVQITLDAGTTWNNLTVSNASYGIGSIGVVNVGNIDHAFGVISPGDSPHFQIRVSVSAATVNTYNLTTGNYNSGTFSLLGGANCTSPVLTVFDAVSNTAISVDNVMSYFGGGNATNISKKLRLEYVCSSGGPAMATFDYLSATTTPSNCFGNQAVTGDPTNPFNFVIAPLDSGTDCSISSSVSFVAPSNAGGTNAASSGTSFTIAHDTTNAKLGLAMVNTAQSTGGLNPNSANDYEMLLDFAMLSTATNLSVQAAYLNASGKLTTPTTSAVLSSSATSWTLPASGWSTSSITNTNFFNASTALTTPASPTVQNLNVVDGALTATIPTIVVGGTNRVLAVSQSGFGGNTPASVIDTGSGNLKLSVINPGTGGSIVGQAITPFDIPNSPTGAAMARVFVTYTGGQTAVFVMAQYTQATGTVYNYGLVNTASGMSINWAPTFTQSTENIVDVTFTSANVPIVLSSASKNLYLMSVPTWNGTTWSGPMSYGTTRSLTGHLATANSIVVVGSDTFAVGGDASNYFYATWFDPTSATLTLNSTNDLSGASYPITIPAASKVTGTTVGGNRVFFIYNPTTGSNRLAAFSAGGAGSCGMSANTLLGSNVSSWTSPPIASGTGIPAAIPVNVSSRGLDGGMMYFTQDYSSPYVHLLLVTYNSCTSGNVNYSNPPKDMGQVNVPISQLIGIQNLSGLSSTTAPTLGLFGVGQYYQFHLNY